MRRLLYVFPCVILFLYFSVLLVLRLPRLGKRELILVLFVRLFGLCLFRFVGFLFLLGSGRAAVCDCGTPWTFLLPFCSIGLEAKVFIKPAVGNIKQFSHIKVFYWLPHIKKEKSKIYSSIKNISAIDIYLYRDSIMFTYNRMCLGYSGSHLQIFYGRIFYYVWWKLAYHGRPIQLHTATIS